MKLRNPILFFIFCFAIIGNLWDLVTTLLIGNAESNPLYHIFGNTAIPLILLKIGVMFSFLWLYNIKVYKNNFTYYFTVSIMVFFTLLVFFASISNTYALTRPEIIKTASEIPASVKMSGYVTFVSIGYIIPMFFNLLIFWIYERTRKNVIING